MLHHVFSFMPTWCNFTCHFTKVWELYRIELATSIFPGRFRIEILTCMCLLVFSEVRVEGLETLDYLDNLKNRERFTEQGDAITFESEVSL